MRIPGLDRFGFVAEWARGVDEVRRDVFGPYGVVGAYGLVASVGGIYIDLARDAVEFSSRQVGELGLTVADRVPRVVLPARVD